MTFLLKAFGLLPAATTTLLHVRILDSRGERAVLEWKRSSWAAPATAQSCSEVTVSMALARHPRVLEHWVVGPHRGERRRRVPVAKMLPARGRGQRGALPERRQTRGGTEGGRGESGVTP